MESSLAAPNLKPTIDAIKARYGKDQEKIRWRRSGRLGERPKPSTKSPGVKPLAGGVFSQASASVFPADRCARCLSTTTPCDAATLPAFHQHVQGSTFALQSFKAIVLACCRADYSNFTRPWLSGHSGSVVRLCMYLSQPAAVSRFAQQKDLQIIGRTLC